MSLKITSRRPKGEDDYRTFSIRIRRETVAQIETIAAETGRSRNELIGILLDYAIANCEVDSCVPSL